MQQPKLSLGWRIQLWFRRRWKTLVGIVVTLVIFLLLKDVLDFVTQDLSIPRPVAPAITSKYQTEYFGPSNTARVRGALKTNLGMGETQYYFAWESDRALETRLSKALNWKTCRREKVTDPKEQSFYDFVCAQYIGFPRTQIWNDYGIYMMRFCPFFQVSGDLFEHADLSTAGGFTVFFRSLDQHKYCVQRNIL